MCIFCTYRQSALMRGKLFYVKLHTKNVRTRNKRTKPCCASCLSRFNLQAKIFRKSNPSVPAYIRVTVLLVHSLKIIAPKTELYGFASKADCFIFSIISIYKTVH